MPTPTGSEVALVSPVGGRGGAAGASSGVGTGASGSAGGSMLADALAAFSSGASVTSSSGGDDGSTRSTDFGERAYPTRGHGAAYGYAAALGLIPPPSASPAGDESRVVTVNVDTSETGELVVALQMS